MSKMITEEAYKVDLEFLFKELTSSYEGLSEEEVKLRQQSFGHNKLDKSKAKDFFAIFIEQFKNPFIYVLVVAFLISLFGHHIVDASIILITVLLSSLIGTFQEYKADRSLQALQETSISRSKVLRSGLEKIILSEEIVPGDILILKAGDKVSADARIINSKDLEINEAVLTGESFAVKKQEQDLNIDLNLADRTNYVFSGTIVEAGIAKALVTHTGVHTEIGKIAALLQSTEEQITPLQEQLHKFGKNLSIALVLVNIVIFSIGIYLKKPIYEMFLTSVALVVAAIPEGVLPAMGIILALGMQKLVKHKGLVRRMVAAETLGSISVICSDKTGTLTTGIMTLTETITKDDIDEIEILKIASICNEGIGSNPTDKAILKAASEANLDQNTLNKLEPKIDEISFSSARKYMATLHKKNNSETIYLKGAPEKILNFTNLNEQEKSFWLEKQEEATEKGYRVIAIAKKDNYHTENLQESDLYNSDLLALMVLKDPVRKESKSAIAECFKAGIRPIILTGDNRKTAMNIAQEIGLELNESEVLEGQDLEKISEEELKDLVNSVKLFARVEPKHKIAIVKALQDNGEVVAMTGDGVNDSPALKKADIGVAVGSGTEIAKETADLILLNDNFKTLVEAIRRGRIIFNNLRKVILALFMGSTSEMIIVTGSILLALPLPILPAQILWVKLIEDTLPAISLSFENMDEDVMLEKPRPRSEPILNYSYIKLIISYALLMDFALLGLFIYLEKETGDLNYARTMVFVSLGITTLVGVFAIRSIKKHVWHINPFSNKLLVLTTFISIFLYLIALYTPFFNKILKTVPLNLHDWNILIAYSVLSIIIYEACKRMTIMKNPYNDKK